MAGLFLTGRISYSSVVITSTSLYGDMSSLGLLIRLIRIQTFKRNLPLKTIFRKPVRLDNFLCTSGWFDLSAIQNVKLGETG